MEWVDRNHSMSGRETLRRKTASWELPDFFGLGENFAPFGANATSQRSVGSPLENDHDLLDSTIDADTIEGMRSP